MTKTFLHLSRCLKGEKNIDFTERCSIFRVFPVTISSTTIFNMGPVVGPLTSLLQQETLPEDGVAECQKVIMIMT